ncbi:transposase [Streptomyces mirabilis]
MRGRLPYPRKERGSRHRSSAGRQRKAGSRRHLICDGRGIPLKAVTTAANVAERRPGRRLVRDV